MTGSASPYGLHLTWQAYPTDGGKIYTVSLFRYKTYDQANDVWATVSSQTTDADFGPVLTPGWLYRAEIRVAGVDEGSGLRVACIDLTSTPATTTP